MKTYNSLKLAAGLALSSLGTLYSQSTSPVPLDVPAEGSYVKVSTEEYNRLVSQSAQAKSIAEDAQAVLEKDDELANQLKVQSLKARLYETEIAGYKKEVETLKSAKSPVQYKLDFNPFDKFDKPFDFSKFASKNVPYTPLSAQPTQSQVTQSAAQTVEQPAAQVAPVNYNPTPASTTVTPEPVTVQPDPVPVPAPYIAPVASPQPEVVQPAAPAKIASPVVAPAIKSQSSLENKVLNSSAIKSGERFDFAADSFYALGVNGIHAIKLYSSANETNAKMAVVLDVNEGVYDWRNEQKVDASVLVIPTGSSVPTPKQSLDLKYKKTADGKAARGGLFGLGFYAASHATGASLIAIVAETGIDYFGGRQRDRSVYATQLDNVPTHKVRSSIGNKLVNEADIDGVHYTLAIDTNSLGKEGQDLFKPDAYRVLVVDLEQYGGHGKGFRIESRDHRMRNNIVALLAGYGAGSLYHQLTKAGSSITGGPNTPGNPTVNPPGTDGGISGGDGNGGPTTNPPRG